MKNEAEKKAAAVETALNFKKVMRGFDPDEVLAYIEEMNRTMQNSSKNFELRMAEMKQELTLVSRERDNLRIRCDELEKSVPVIAEPEPQSENPIEKDGENPQELIDELQKRLDDEYISEASVQRELQNAHAEISEMSAQLQDKEKQLSSCLEKIDILEAMSQKQDSIRTQYEEALAQIETLKASVGALQEEKAQLEKETADADEHINKAFDENSSLKTELSRINVENALLFEKNEQYKAEISELKSEAKAKAYTYAEKLSAEEDALNKEKMKLQKKLQMQNYHIEQADAAIDELKKQIEQIRTSFSE